CPLNLPKRAKQSSPDVVFTSAPCPSLLGEAFYACLVFVVLCFLWAVDGAQPRGRSLSLSFYCSLFLYSFYYSLYFWFSFFHLLFLFLRTWPVLPGCCLNRSVPVWRGPAPAWPPPITDERQKNFPSQMNLHSDVTQA
ncbi:unnamed protein product, partial [Discosporangium mesarthrocarpum]